MRIEGQQIALRDVLRADMKNKVRWYNDPQVNKTLLLEENLDLEKTLKWFDEHAGDNTRREFIIENKQGESIGIAGLVRIDRTHQTAEIYCVIGETKYWGKGVMLETEKLLITYAFKEMGLEKIWACAVPANIASIVTMKKLGFKIEGTLRKENIIRGQRIDVIRVGLLREEFKPI